MQRSILLRLLRVRVVRACHRAFPREFRDEWSAIRSSIGNAGASYARRPGLWLLGGLTWWSIYLLLLCALLSIPFGRSLNTALEIAFAITAPPRAVTQAYAVTNGLAFDDVRGTLSRGSQPVPFPDRLHLIGQLGWLVIITFTFLIPALIALVLEKLPSVVNSLRPLAHPEVWEFLSMYTRVFHEYAQAIPRIEASGLTTDADIRSELLDKIRVGALRAIAEMAKYWFRDRGKLNANASFMRAITGVEAPVPDEKPLYTKMRAGDRSELLHLVAWAFKGNLPTSVLIDVDRTAPHPGAPYAVTHGQYDVVSKVLDADEWRARGLREPAVKEALTYFKGVPFRSMVSIPVHDVFGGTGRVIGVVTIQVDKPSIFAPRNPETTSLVELVSRFCYVFAWLETKNV